MSNLRPNSVCDTTPLQRLESQSSSSEPSSPTLVGDGLETGSAPSSGVTTLSLANHNNNNNHKIDLRLSDFANDKRQIGFHGTRRMCGRIFLDMIILGCVGLPILGFHLFGDSYKRGFFCDDQSLKHPYRSSTVHSWMLYLMGLVLPIAMITFIEFIKSNSNKMRGFGNFTEKRYYFWHLAIPEWIVECYKKIGVLVFGAGVCQLSTDIAKYSVGRLRPHFFAVCQPIMYDSSTCDDPLNAGKYIEDFSCSSLDATPRMLKEISLSFPSGHATFSFYTMVYIAIYLQKRMTWKRTNMFKHLLQFIFLMFAWYTALTRVSDYKHHWTDVLAGSVMGILYAIVVTSSMW